MLCESILGSLNPGIGYIGRYTKARQLIYSGKYLNRARCLTYLWNWKFGRTLTMMIYCGSAGKGPMIDDIPKKDDDGSCASGGWKREDGRLSCGYSSFRGKRASMEDFFDVKAFLIHGESICLFGIFDGHGGSRAAEYLKGHLFENLIKHPEFIARPKLAISDTYQQTDRDFLESEKDTSRDDGSTATTAVLVGNRLYVANVGDSRTIISKAGKAIPLSQDHKPNRNDERKRIESAGGVVMWAEYHGLLALGQKLKRMKAALIQWNRISFGRTELHIQSLQQHLDQLEEDLQAHYSESTEVEYQMTKSALHLWESREISRLTQISKKNWLKDGEKNTTLFHTYIKSRQNSKCITQMTLQNGRVMESPKEIHLEAVNYYASLLSRPADSVVQPHVEWDTLFSHKLTEVENATILRGPTAEEIKEALWTIPNCSSSGPDGFSSGFYKSTWNVTGSDLVSAIKEFFEGQHLPRMFASNTITLIAKVDQPDSFDKFRPISLSTVVYKVISKVIVARLKEYMPKLISQEQGAFLEGRSIFENIGLAQEMVHYLHKKNKGGNVMLKLDMVKAFDKVSWEHLQVILKAKGFNSELRGLIMRCVQGQWFSVHLNGVSLGFFQSSRGLRQGDPLSPFLFILMQDALSQILSKEFAQGNISSYHHPVGAPRISHLMYADDILIFSGGDSRSLKRLMKVLDAYCAHSGQSICRAKSAIYMSKHIQLMRKRQILDITGFMERNLPMVYLGAPVCFGRLNRQAMEPFLNKIRKRLAGWKGKLMSQGGRLILIRHVLSSLPLHIMAALKIPLWALKEINKIMANFFWGEVDGKRKLHWKRWIHLCKPTTEGGIGIRDICEVQKALGMKLCFNLMVGSSLWKRFLMAKYTRTQPLLLRIPRSTDSRLWKHAMLYRMEVLENIKIIIRKGDSSFWFDKWLSSGILAVRVDQIQESEATLQDMMINSQWDEQKLTQLVGGDVAAEILAIKAPRPPEEPDKLIWKPDPQGRFTLKTAWEAIRGRTEDIMANDILWHKALPTKISLCAWKAWMNCLPTDENIQKKGVQLASSCHCCTIKSQESTSHILSDSPLATNLWNRAAHVLGVCFSNPLNWQERIQQWQLMRQKSGLRGYISLIIPAVLTWHLWLSRCRARFEGHLSHEQQIWCQVGAYIASLTSTNSNFHMQVHDEALMQRLGIRLTFKPCRQARVIYWEKPPTGWVKLNTDGSCMGNPGNSGAGGIIRNHNGICLAAYSYFLGEGTNNAAELQAATQGLQLCLAQGWKDVILETDSMLLVHWITTNKDVPWYLWDFWEDFKTQFTRLNCHVQHKYREGNAPADFLAKQASSGVTANYWRTEELPRLLKGLVRLDKLHMATVRLG